MGPLDILATAIADCGYFRWWVQPRPDIILLEFGGVQLLRLEGDGTRPPPSTFGLRFETLSMALFASDGGVSDDWPMRLQQDQLDPPTVEFDSLSFSDSGACTSVLELPRRSLLVGAGEVDAVALFEKASARIAFLAGPVGVVVCGDRLRLVSHAGEHSLEEVAGMHARWWEYWERYWSVRDTVAPLPRDYACEVSIPAGRR